MTYCPWLYYVDPPIIIIRSNSEEVRGRLWSHTMSKQPNVEYSRKEKTGQTQETNRLRKEQIFAWHVCRAWPRENSENTSVKRKQGRPKKQTYFGRSKHLPDMCAEHGLEKSSESTTVKRKRGRPKKQKKRVWVGTKACQTCVTNFVVSGKVLTSNENGVDSDRYSHCRS